jgi:Ferritin-like domain
MPVAPSSSSALFATRRRLLTGGRPAVLSATTVALLVGRTAKAHSGTQTADQIKSDAETLNAVLDIEFEGIAAYQAAAETGLLQPAVLKLAVGFQSDHKQHGEALAPARHSTGSKLAKLALEYAPPRSNLGLGPKGRARHAGCSWPRRHRCDS